MKHRSDGTQTPYLSRTDKRNLSNAFDALTAVLVESTGTASGLAGNWQSVAVDDILDPDPAVLSMKLAHLRRNVDAAFDRVNEQLVDHAYWCGKRVGVEEQQTADEHNQQKGA